MATKNAATLEAAMSGQSFKIICEALRTARAEPADLHDHSGHHRYYGSSAENSGERIVEVRGGERPRARNVCGF